MKQQEQFSSRLGFILSAAGAAIGLGAIWKFPYIAGENGGGAFLLLFLIFTMILGLPLLLAEFSIGRTAQQNAVRSFQIIAPGTKWYLIGILGMISVFVLLSFYSVVGGWIITYFWKMITGQLNGLTEPEYAEIFASTIANPAISLGAQLFFMIITIIVITRGVQNGIEQANKIMMPALAILFIILVIRSVTLDGASAGFSFLFYPDFSKVTAHTVLDAMGQSFFTLSLGVSAMITYSSYLPKDQNMPKSAVSIVAMNIMVVLLAGLVIFPAVFAFGMEPDAGPTLLFNVLPTIFSQMPAGMLFFAVFLIVFLFATLTSAFSMLEIIVAVLSRGNKRKRKQWAWIIGFAIFLFGIPSSLSFGLLSDVSLFGKSWFDLADYMVSNVFMPTGALLISIFISFKMKKSALYEEIKSGSNLRFSVFQAWFFLIRYIVPVLIILVMLDVIKG
ncbi:putative sodium-dependent transporter YocR [Compostibacillus humi]|uniref:Transporter n=1 Tax=Compostibacillus humi TaxID=1245525 RepID=A0A8J2TQ76_9BACI|nr:sodium-dependent transporter [Compostibacillus humi]GFZ84765.1 putative sodium-dependent transporter YocR [Compostibacillus humi]HLT56485.1 sodium-dependent transporter [Bacillota bacterium]